MLFVTVISNELAMDKGFKKRNVHLFAFGKISDNFIVSCLLKTLFYLTNIFHVQCFSLVNAVEIFKIFPPKVLEKYGRPKYACAVFFL